MEQALSSESEPKWRRRAEDRPDEVLDAALSQFVRRGFAATKVEDIAREAGLSKGAIYRYFTSKEDILESLIRRAIVPIAERVSELARTSTGDPVEVMRSMMSVVIVNIANPNTLAIPRLVLQESGTFPQLAEIYRREVLDRGVSAMEKLIERGVAEGYFRPVHPRLAVRNVIGPFIAHVLLVQVFGMERRPEETMEAFLESHLDILMKGLSKEPEGA